LNTEISNIINGCLQKDLKAQKALYNLFVDKLYYTAIRYISDDFFIQNILQDVFLKAFNNINTYDANKGALSTWLNTIAIRECLNHLRKRQLEFVSIEDNSISPVDKVDTILLEMDAEELLETIRRIPSKYRIVFNLYEIDGYNHNEIANILNVTASTSRSYLTRAKKLIQKEILLDSNKMI